MGINSVRKVLSTLAVSSLLLAACGGNEEGSGKNAGTTPKGPAPKQVETSKFSTSLTNDKKAVDGGTFTYGLVSDTPFEGVLNRLFYEGAPDYEVIQFFDESLLDADENYIYNQDGAATYKLSEDNKTITLKIRDNVNWHNGDPVTAEDLEYAYEVVGSKKYAGPRYDAQTQGIEGMTEYHDGKAKKISGIKVIDEKTISITFKEANPSVLTGLMTSPLPKKYLAGIPIDKLDSSDQIRKKPIGFGPFKIKKMVPGESVEFERNDDYYRGKPKLDKVILKVVNPSVVAASLEKGDIDFAEITADQYESAEKLKNIEVIGKVGLAYTYIGFKLGHYDAEKGLNVMDNPKFADKRVRQAFGYAIDNKTVGERFYKGLRFPANTVIPPSFPKYHDDKVKGFTYDPEKAKKLLDEAGFKDTDGDGLREDADGKKFKINFATMSGTDIAEPLAQYYIQAWKAVGLDVQLLDGRLVEFNSFYDMLEKDDPKVDIYQGAWGTGSDPDPSGIWDKTAPFNYNRWVNDENDKLLKEGISPKAFDEKYRQDVYNKWQELIADEAPSIPTLYRFEIFGANKRVKNYDLQGGASEHWWDVSVTDDKPETSK
ncbi:oligopeptide ABC transporter substrate-binding protein [Priestia koreensis]|uniref:oligopeptide ABC transporter substrate-binding protein n=1 Tax=Priestia koreensis TaxID=284581 RepID=UPI00203CE913|nr:oligopeptide ABC transporter substrate-binding protein [Priestia koreensis]MCM3004712.1 oligopeptide ABC transporter substrate-binding protein [Priestia koreensis]